jgi:hypothetical protein
VGKRLGNSFAFWAITFVFAAAILSLIASENAWVGGVNRPEPSGTISVYLLLPAAIVFGLICGIFLVKHSPEKFMEEGEMSADPEERRRAGTFRGIDFIGFLSFSAFVILPIALIEIGLRELGF